MIDVNVLWSRLAVEGRFELIKKLHRAECRELGFGTVVVRREGFSDNDGTHNMVLSFLRQIGVNIFNPGLETMRLERALHEKHYEN